MALDHYVSQVHLRNFYSPVLGERMYCIRKSDGKSFTPNSGSVCRIEEGSTNSYLMEDRAVEEFLKGVEPKYNASVAKLEAGEFDAETIYVIAGFAAYIQTCSPTAMRLHSAPLKSMLESTARALDARGAFPQPPASLGANSLTELLQRGELKFTVDPKYPQAIGITNILRMVKMLGNSAWEVLRNPFEDSYFFSSDYPSGIEESGNPMVINHITPLSPSVALRIFPDPSLRHEQLDLAFGRLRGRVRTIDRAEVRNLNRLIVQCAEDLVFFRDDKPWVKSFVTRYAHYQVGTQTRELETPDGAVLISQQLIQGRP
jgi:hypothetical protein